MGKTARDPSRASSDPYMNDSPHPGPSSHKRRKRDLLGCLTCRVRRKKCDGPTGDDDRPCVSCRRNSLGCLGYSGASPPWAGRSQLRLRECSLRSKLWIELSKGGNRPSGAILDLSFYKQPDLSLELSATETEILNALEWQAYLHSPDKEKVPSCPQPDFCQLPMTLDQMVQHGLLQVSNHQQFPHVPYDPHPSNENQRRKRKAVAQSQTPPPTGYHSVDIPADAQPSPSPSNVAVSQQDHEMSGLSVARKIPDAHNSPPNRVGAGLNPRLTRTLPPPTRQSLTDSVETPVSGLMRRRGAMSGGTLDPSSHFPRQSAQSSFPGQPDYRLTPLSTLGGLGQRGEQTLLGENVSFRSLSHPISHIVTGGELVTEHRALPPIQQLNLGMERFRSQQSASEPLPSADMPWSARAAHLTSLDNPRGRNYTASPSNSASPSPSASEYSRESTPQHYRAPEWDRNSYPTDPSGTVGSNRTWALNASSNVQSQSSFTNTAYASGYSSAPPFLRHYVEEGIAPHEQAPQTTQGRPFSSLASRLPTRSRTLPQTHSLPRASGDERSPSPRELRLFSLEPFPPDERME